MLNSLRLRSQLWISKKPVFSAVLLSAVCVMMLYGASLFAGFAQYDDQAVIVGNPAVHSLGASLKNFTSPTRFANDLKTSGDSYYRPLFWLSLAADYSLWGSHPLLFHATNLALHTLCGALLFLLLTRLRFSFPSSVAAVVLWLALPINSEAVIWISARAYSLSTVFVLAALLCAERYLRSPSRRLLVGYLLFALCALFSHEEGLLLLPLMLLVAQAAGSLRHRTTGLLALATLATDLLYLLAIHAVGVQPLHHFVTFSVIGKAGLKYILWMLLPIHLSIERSTDLPSAGWSFQAAIGWFLLALAPISILLFRKIARIRLTGVLWMTICLLPAIVFVNYQGMAERFVYLASIGFAILISSILDIPLRFLKIVGSFALLAWIIGSGVRIQARISDWKDPARLYESSLEASPKSFRLFYNLGLLDELNARYEDALKRYMKSVQLNDQFQSGLAAEANMYLRMNLPTQAKPLYEKALLLDEKDIKSRNNYGIALQKLGRLNDAKLQYLKAISAAPNDDAAFCNLASLFFQIGESKVAEMLLSKAMTIDPNDPLPYSNLAQIYTVTGRTDLAIPLYRKLLVLTPNDPSVIEALARATQAPH